MSYEWDSISPKSLKEKKLSSLLLTLRASKPKSWPCSKSAVLRKEWMLANACLVFSGQTCGLGRRLGHLLLLLCWVLSNPVVPHNPCDGSSFPKLWLRSSNKTFPTLKMCFGWVQGSLTLTLNKATAYFHGRGGRICCLQASDTLCLLYQKDKCGKKPKQGRTRSLKRLDKQVSLKLQNQADATCWPRRVLVMHSLCISPLLAVAVLLGLCPGLLLGKDWSISFSDSSSRIFKGSPLSLHIFASIASHWQGHSSEASDFLKLLGSVVIGRDHTWCLWH